MKSISRRCIKTETICDTSLDVWMLLLESFEYQAFIGIQSSKAKSLLHDTSKTQFMNICQSISRQCKTKLPSNDWVKLMGPLDNLDSAIKEFDNFICLKPYASSGLKNKSGVFLQIILL